MSTSDRPSIFEIPHDTRYEPPSNRSERAARTAATFEQIARCTDDDAREELLERIVLLNIGVADAVVSRYRNRGVPEEDLNQVAYLALVRAAQKFDPARGHDFLSYCVPTIRGEVRRYFRDLGWTVRPPRRIQEMQKKVNDATAELSQTLTHAPTVDDIAAFLETDAAEVREAMSGDGCFHPTSLDLPVGERGSGSLGDLLGDEDTGRDAAEARVVLAPVVRRLGERDRRILKLRFFDGLTQQEIADDIGVTQMQVSRLLSRIYADLRQEITGQPKR